ncbi:MAG: hypothetical protein AAB447_01865 [Patescibacteria group bacterium]
MSKNKLEISTSVMRAIEMTRDAIRELAGRDLRWMQTDVITGAIRDGRNWEALKSSGILTEDLHSIEHLRTIRIEAYVDVSHTGQTNSTKVIAVCELSDYGFFDLEPVSVSVQYFGRTGRLDYTRHRGVASSLVFFRFVPVVAPLTQ